jgi:type VI secretion system secreted protein VgrG
VILLEADEILLRAKTFRVEVPGGYAQYDSTGIEHGTTGKFIAHASLHGLPGPKDQLVDLSPKKICVECITTAARGGSALVPR